MRKIGLFLMLLITGICLNACELNFVIPTLPTNSCTHQYVESIEKEATCNTEGIKIFTCSICNNSYEETYFISHNFVNDRCTFCYAVESDSYLVELFGEDVNFYTDDERNPYGIDLSKYGDDVIAVFYNPDLENYDDPYINVDKNEFYKNYEEAESYEDAYYRTKHYLMSGDITPQDHIAEEGIKDSDSYIKCSTATYVLDADGNYLAYIPNTNNSDNHIIFYGAAYTALDEIAAYMLAFGEQPINTNYDKNSSGKSQAIAEWGEYGRVNNGTFRANSSYKYQPSFPSGVTWIESDFGTIGGFIAGDGVIPKYNNGYSITRGTVRFVYSKKPGIVPIEERYVFYTYNHYNDFQEYLNYDNGWSGRYGNESAGNPYCSGKGDWKDSFNSATQRPDYLFKTYSELFN